MAWKKFKKRPQEIVYGVGSEFVREGEVECEGSASVADRGALRLCASTKT